MEQISSSNKKEKLPRIIIIISVCVNILFLVHSMITKPESTVTGSAKSDAYVSGIIYQESAEVAAQYKQAYALATVRLQEAIANVDTNNNGIIDGNETPLAIVTDIDGTLLDDSTYFAGALLNDSERSNLGLDAWDNNDWCGYYKAIASTADTPVPGAIDFITYAYDCGVEVYYITNRPYYELDLTVQQLIYSGFITKESDLALSYSAVSDASTRLQEYHTWTGVDINGNYNQEVLQYKTEVIDPSDYILEEGEFTLENDYRIQVQGSEFSSDKASRRANVAEVMEEKGGKIVLYLGDSLNDMVSNNEYLYTDYSQNLSESFSKAAGNDARTSAVMNDTWREKWGTEFIVMPNAAYGDWQKATWNNETISASDQQQSQKQQLIRHSYTNTEEYTTWYNGPSPIGDDVQ